MKKKGFTLVELVITITIIIVLSSVSVPIYRNHATKAKLSEAYVLLAAIRDAQIRYHNEYGCFLFGHNSSGWETYNEEVLGINARMNKYSSLFCVGNHNTNGVNDYQFEASVKMPRELWAARQTYLALLYNLTSGMTYSKKNNV